MPTFVIRTPGELAAIDAKRPTRRRQPTLDEAVPERSLEERARVAYDAEHSDQARPRARWMAAFKVAIKAGVMPVEARRIADDIEQLPQQVAAQ